MRLRSNNVNSLRCLANREISNLGDGNLFRCTVNRFATAKSLYHKTIQGHYGCVNALEFSHGDEALLASGSDDRRVLLWKVTDLIVGTGCQKNVKMRSEHHSNIFCLAFTVDDEHLLSAGNDSQVILHNLQTGEAKDVYLLEDSVYSLSSHPASPNIFCTASEDGKLTVFDIRAPRTTDPSIAAKSNCSYQSVMFNPVQHTLLLSTNEKDGVQLWDTRKPRKSLGFYDNVRGTRSAMCARWNNRGDLILVLRRRQLPSLYHLGNPNPLAFFDDSGYFNACTLKSCTFGGPDDRYIMTGSDNFDCLIWPVPDLKTTSLNEPPEIVEQAMTLIGHRSVVNQVRYSQANSIIASSGVEKIIKLWSPWPLANGRGSVVVNDQKPAFSPKRQLYTEHEFDRYVTLRDETQIQNTVHNNPEESNIAEDPGMLAFFDSIVRMEMTGIVDRSFGFPLDESDSDETDEVTNHQYYDEIQSLTSSDSDDNVNFPNYPFIKTMLSMIRDGTAAPDPQRSTSDIESISAVNDSGTEDEESPGPSTSNPSAPPMSSALSSTNSESETGLRRSIKRPALSNRELEERIQAASNKSALVGCQKWSKLRCEILNEQSTGAEIIKSEAESASTSSNLELIDLPADFTEAASRTINPSVKASIKRRKTYRHQTLSDEDIEPDDGPTQT